MKLLSFSARLECFNLPRAFSSICRIRSRVSSKSCPTSSRVWFCFSPIPNRILKIFSSLWFSVDFGCGSSRENAPIALKGAGDSCVIARSFARIFFRNSINIGFPILESGAAVDEAETGDEIQADLATGTITNVTKKSTYQTSPFPEIIQEIIRAGGMVGFVRQRIAQKKAQAKL